MKKTRFTEGQMAKLCSWRIPS